MDLIEVYERQEKYDLAIKVLKLVIEREKGDKIDLHKKMVAYGKKTGNK